jgi:hypothetical protein
MAGGVAQGVGPEFKPQYCKNKTKPKPSWVQWLTPIILATQEAEIRRSRSLKPTPGK